MNFIITYHFEPERMKIKKVEKLVTNLYDKNELVIHIRNLIQALNYTLNLKKVKRMIKFNQKDCSKSYIDIETKLRQKAKHNFEKECLMNNAVFGKTVENVRKCRDIKLVKAERRCNYLVLEPNYHTTKSLAESLLTIEMKKNSNTNE